MILTSTPRVVPAAPAAGLVAGQLGTRDVTVSTVANIGPGIDFYFAFGASPLPPGSPRR